MNQWDRAILSNLNVILANLYPTQTDSRRITAKARVNTAALTFENQALNNWFNILEYANPRGQVDQIVQSALDENPEDEALKNAMDRAPPPPVTVPDPSAWEGPKTQSSLERIMGERSTLVPITYLEIGMARARSVVRVKRENGSSGSGFVTGENLLITNNHVLPTRETAATAVVQFNYQQTAAGLDASIEQAKLSPDQFFKTSIKDDWTAVKIERDVLSRWGAIAMGPTSIAVGDHVNIIQHPGGGPKQISLFANVVAYVGHGRVQYLTDTLPGSSGSPVFNSQWNVVALHHSGGWLTEPNAASKTTYYRNEGISIDCIIAGLA